MQGESAVREQKVISFAREFALSNAQSARQRELFNIAFGGLRKTSGQDESPLVFIHVPLMAWQAVTGADMEPDSVSFFPKKTTIQEAAGKK